MAQIGEDYGTFRKEQMMAENKITKEMFSKADSTKESVEAEGNRRWIVALQNLVTWKKTVIIGF